MEKKASEMMGVTFNGSVTFNGPMFDIHDNQHVHIGMSPMNSPKEGEKQLSNEQLVQAVEECQMYMWGNSAYAVVFCVLRDRFGLSPNKTAFERMVEELPYDKNRTYKCPKGTVTNAFSDNPVYNYSIDKWEANDAQQRIIKLRDELLKRLEI